jgi:GDP-4-dehydro-6-deoxy-D-mannose reductase
VPQLKEGVNLARILITGVSGFVGKHLLRELSGRGHEVVGVGLQPKADPAIIEKLADYFQCDLTDAERVRKIPLDGITGVINLAGLAQTGSSFSEPEKYKQVNVKVFSILAERIVAETRPIRMLAISTGAAYDASQPLPITEGSKLVVKGSPYALSKILMEQKAQELAKAGLDCVIARPFNHIGPGQEPGFLVPDLYQEIRSSLTSGQPASVGNLKTKRDYTDVRDVVRAYAELIAEPKLSHDIYNVCSGHSVSGEDILEMLLKACGADDKLKIEVDESLIRPDDPADIYGSAERLAADTGWRPHIKIERTIRDFVNSMPA